MENSTRSVSPAEADLWRAYRSAFEDFARAARAIQRLTAHPHPEEAAVDAALLALERARKLYTQRRDALAHHLSAGRLPDSPQERSIRVRPVARLRWEVAGRREGAAEEDWLRAEQIVHAALTEPRAYS